MFTRELIVRTQGEKDLLGPSKLDDAWRLKVREARCRRRSILWSIELWCNGLCDWGLRTVAVHTLIDETVTRDITLVLYSKQSNISRGSLRI